MLRLETNKCYVVITHISILGTKQVIYGIAIVTELTSVSSDGLEPSQQLMLCVVVLLVISRLRISLVTSGDCLFDKKLDLDQLLLLYKKSNNFKNK